MKKFYIFIGMVAMLIVVIVITALFTSRFYKTGGYSLDREIAKLKNDIGFYRDFNRYQALLSDVDFSYIREKADKLEEDKEVEDLLGLVAVSELLKNDQRAKEIVFSLRDSINKTKQEAESKEIKDEIFQKNTTCASLAQGIKTALESKYKSSTTESEKLESVFYSPKLNTCVYITENDYTSRFGTYENTVTKKIYNANSQTLITSLRVYSSKDSDDKAEVEKSNKNRREYVKFVLENSNNNVDLFKDVSWSFF